MALYTEFYKQYISDSEVDFEKSKNFNCILPDHAGDRNSKSSSINFNTGVYYCQSHCHRLSAAEFLNKYDPTISLDEAHTIVREYLINNKESIEDSKPEDFSKTLIFRNTRFENLYKESLVLMNPDSLEVRNYIYDRGIKYETLVARGVGWLPEDKTNWAKDSLVFPYFYNHKISGIRYRDAGTNKICEKGTYKHLWGIDQLDNPDFDNGILIIVEGETDALCTYQAVEGKYPVVGVPGSSFKKEWSRDIQGVRQIICVLQDDIASKKLSTEIKSIREDAIFVWLPWKMYQVGNDVSDWLHYNKPEDLLSLIESKVDLKKREILPAEEFLKEADKEDVWMINNLLERQNVIAFGGKPKSKKTIAALNLIRSIYSGEPFLGYSKFTPVEGSKEFRTLVIEEEGSGSELAKRVVSIMDGVDGWKDKVFFSHMLGIKFDVDASVDMVINFCKKEKIDLVFFDPYFLMHTKDENEASAVRVFWNNVARLLRECNGITLIVIHHFGRGGDVEKGFDAIRGSNSFDGAIDTLLGFETIEATAERGVKLVVSTRKKPVLPEDGKKFFPLYLQDNLVIRQATEEDFKVSSTEVTDELIEGLMKGKKKISFRDFKAATGLDAEEFIKRSDGGVFMGLRLVTNPSKSSVEVVKADGKK